MLIGYMTDSTLIGGMMGGNLIGAAIGDMLNTGDQATNQAFDVGFGGGDFGGAGAGGSWEDDKNSENFS
jgi:hypothetical protein